MPLSLSLYVRLGGGLRLFQKRGDGPASLFLCSLWVYVLCVLAYHKYYSGTSDKGPSEIGTTSLQRTLVAAPC